MEQSISRRYSLTLLENTAQKVCSGNWIVVLRACILRELCDICTRVLYGLCVVWIVWVACCVRRVAVCVMLCVEWRSSDRIFVSCAYVSVCGCFVFCVVYLCFVFCAKYVPGAATDIVFYLSTIHIIHTHVFKHMCITQHKQTTQTTQTIHNTNNTNKQRPQRRTIQTIQHTCTHHTQHKTTQNNTKQHKTTQNNT